jgi:hypothetical protein
MNIFLKRKTQIYKYLKIYISLKTSIVILFTVIFLLLLYTQHKYVILSGDDYYQASSKSIPLNQIYYYSLFDYLHWKGRFFTSFLNYFVVNGHVLLWKIINPFMITTIVFSVYYFSASRNAKFINRIVALLYIFNFFLTLNQDIAREVLYWITGSINYLWPLTVSFVYLITWLESFGVSRKRRIFKFVALLLALYAGNSFEQYSVILIGLSLIIVFYNKKRGYVLDKTQIFILTFLCLGGIFLYFAPGNFNRYFTFSKFNSLYYQYDQLTKLNIRFSEITTVIFSSKISGVFFNLIFGFSTLALLNIVISGIKISRIHKFVLSVAFGIISIVSLFIRPDLSMYIANIINPGFITSGTIFSVNTFSLSIFWVGFICLTIYLGVIYYKYDKSPILLISILLALLSQVIMLLIAPYSPYRTFFVTVVFMLIGICHLIMRLDNKYIIIPVFITVLYLYFQGLSSYVDLIGKYKNNYNIMTENEKTITDYKKNFNGPLIIKKLPNIKYGFNMPYYESDSTWDSVYAGFILKYFLNYYDLPNNQKIYWITNETN